MKEYNFLYAVRNENTRELISKRNGNPFYVSKHQVEQAKKFEESYRWNKGEKFKVVTFKIEEVGDE